MNLSEFFWKDAMKRYEKSLHHMAQGEPCRKIIDLGCGNGEFTLKIASWIDATEIWGIEGNPESAGAAESRGIKAFVHDLNEKFPLPEASFDLVLSHFTIEYVSDVDNFVSEIKRVLKKGGGPIIGTENLAGTHNIAALLLGFQPFPMSIALSSRFRVGNPLQERNLDPLEKGEGLHAKVFAFQGLRDIFKVHGFRVEKIRGAGYFPFPGCLGSLLAAIDPRHAAFNIIKARKT